MNTSTAGEEASALLDGLPWPPTKADVMRALVQSNNAGFSRCLRKQLIETEQHNKEMAELDRSPLAAEFSLDARRIQHTAKVLDMVFAAMERKS